LRRNPRIADVQARGLPWLVAEDAGRVIGYAYAAAGRGLGRRLYGALLEWLHEALGFAPIGTFREVGWKLGRWVDVGYWQRVLDAGVA